MCDNVYHLDVVEGQSRRLDRRRLCGARGGSKTYRILKFIMSSYRPEPVLLTEGGILVPYYEI